MLDATEPDLPNIIGLHGGLPSLGFVKEPVALLLREINFSAINSVIDIGCGFGNGLSLILPLVAEQALVVGLDANPDIIREAKERTMQRWPDLEQPHFLCADARRLPLARDFDLVIFTSMGRVLGSYRETLANLMDLGTRSAYILTQRTVERSRTDDYQMESSEPTGLEMVCRIESPGGWTAAGRSRSMTISGTTYTCLYQKVTLR